MTDPLRLRDLEREMKGFAEAWLHDEPGIKSRAWLSFVVATAPSNLRLCREGRCRILAHAVREP